MEKRIVSAVIKEIGTRDQLFLTNQGVRTLEIEVNKRGQYPLKKPRFRILDETDL